MREIPWILGGGAFAAYWLTRPRGSSSSSTKRPSRLPGRWVWPVQLWQGRKPVVSDGFNSPRPGLPRHGGVDIMYRRTPNDPFRAGTTNADKWFVMPDDIVGLAASDGVLWSATRTPAGYAVVVDHTPRPYATFYTHFEKLLVPEMEPGKHDTRVRAGEPLGIIGASPLDAEHLKHLHFSLWNGGPMDAIDPEPLMRTWGFVNDPRAIRNGSFMYRPVGDSGEPYPTWVRELDGKSGVYIIRERNSSEIVYVGESHTDRLYDTLTRHFQTWRRKKGFWGGMYGQGHDPGLTYERGKCDVAVRITSREDAIDEEARLIARLSPRDNLLGKPVDDEEVPF